MRPANREILRFAIKVPNQTNQKLQIIIFY